MLKHLVFDFGGVILDLDGVHTGYPDTLAKIFEVPLQDAVELWNANKTLVITGKESPSQFLARIQNQFGFKFNVDQGLTYWEEQNHIDRSRIDWELLSKIKEWGEEYQIHMLTDQIQLKNGASAWIDQVDSYFNTILRSYEQGYRKPYAAAYQNLLQKIGAVDEASSVLFIDDNQANVEAAEAAKIHALLYTFKDHQPLIGRIAELSS